MGRFIDKPMKAADFEADKLRFPYIGSYKLDGYRAFSFEGLIRTSSGTPVLNKHTHDLFKGYDFEGLDGELIVGPWSDKNAFHNTSGPVRKTIGEPDVKWYIFDDRTDPDMPFVDRVRISQKRVKELGHKSIIHIPQVVLDDYAAMLRFESEAIELGFEGIMLRDPYGPYKYGRSTVNENYLLKVKRFISEEATIIALEERMENLNESTVNNFGLAKKSISKENQVGTGMVGAFVVESPQWPTTFRIAATTLGFKGAKHAWENPNEYIGQLARFKYFPHGVVDVPRHGVFEAIRGREDL